MYRLQGAQFRMRLQPNDKNSIVDLVSGRKYRVWVQPVSGVTSGTICTEWSCSTTAHPKGRASVALLSHGKALFQSHGTIRKVR
jgi:hypothetical protein